MRVTIALGAFLFIAACATGGSRGKVENGLIDFGLSEERAECIANELDDRLDRSDMADVAYFLEGINDASSAGGALDALLEIDNPRAATAIGRAGLACAFG
ncbi:MAG: hypothetical protein HKP25_01015 [Marinicaulis sp.]|nr:hypothetical protein [Marinicaulis sp.]NNL87625.1 hypothetical protein [Marinicaulis sp.]